MDNFSIPVKYLDIDEKYIKDARKEHRGYRNIAGSVLMILSMLLIIAVAALMLPSLTQLFNGLIPEYVIVLLVSAALTVLSVSVGISVTALHRETIQVQKTRAGLLYYANKGLYYANKGQGNDSDSSVSDTDDPEKTER